MRLLVIGGTRFVGKHLVEAALAAGHDVTLVHRSSTTLFPSARHVLADRNRDLSALGDGEWDATVDVCAYLPTQVRALADALGDRGGHHVLVSTVSVYGDLPGPDGDEDSPLLPVAGDDVEEVTDETYGPLKVACERAAATAYGDRLSVVRPTYVVGPDDPTGRYPWWIRRMARGGEVLAPGARTDPAQVVDVRDLAAFQLRLATGQVSGVFNAVRPAQPWSELLEATAEIAPTGTSLTWVDGSWLTEQGLTGADLPLWSEGVADWESAMSPARAEAAGLRHRPLSETVRDTASWATDDHLVEGVGLTAARETELLARWVSQ
ncbi:NAD-dependent epimerase/dehydratase family protein [Nocardioides sp.]|uniref:NAD-dependent epimerase/dehydratase family protein n=1 Tax=Nocardioides sp. TaxID=35761 RepID=UPI002ED1FFD5